jgi:hypothetical protein
MAIIPINDCGKGVNKDLLPAELELGVWSDAVNFHFTNGFAELFRGTVDVFSGLTDVREWLENYGTATTRFLVEGCGTKVFVHDGTTRTEITRFTTGVNISTITNVTTTATATTAAAHGRTTGDSVTVYGATPSAYNGTFTITVTGATSFTYTMLSDPGGTATTVGAYSFNVQSNFTAGPGVERFSGGVLGGILIMNKPSDGLYYWNGNTALRLRRFPKSNLCDSARVYKNFIVMLGCTVDGVKRPHNVAWSSSAEPGAIPSSFTSTATNDAGDVDLAETPGVMIDSLPLGDVNIIYKEDARYSQQFIPGNDVFRFVRLPGNDGLFARDCVVNTPVGHVFLTQAADVKIHQGGEAKSIANGRIRKWIGGFINRNSARKAAYLAVNIEKNEVWVCFQTTNGSSAYADYFAVWNWESDTWGLFEFVGSGGARLNIPFAKSASWPTGITLHTAMMMSTLQHGSSSSTVEYINPLTNQGQIGGVAVSGVLERTGMHMEDRTTYKALQRSRPAVDGDATEAATIYHGSSKTADGAVTYTAGTTYTTGATNFADGRATSGPYLAWKLTTSANPYLMRSLDLDVSGGGKR